MTTTQKKITKSTPRKTATPKANVVLEGYPAIGSAIPSLVLTDDQGERVSLKELKGKTVILYFYPKDDTPGCTREACDFKDSMKELKSRGVVVLGVSKDSLESHAKFKTKYKLTFPLLSDEDGRLCEKLGVWREKLNYGKKYMGIVRTTFVYSPEGKLLKIYPKVKVDGHVAKIIADLETLEEA